MAQAQSPQERDDDSLAKMMSTEGGRGARREGRFRRAISRMVKSQEPPSPETELGNPVHQPVHPHSQEPDDRSSGGEATPVTEPSTGPFSASAENGYRPASRVSVPNPYTTRNVEVDDVDTGATPVGQWRGVGLDEPEPRSQNTPATTDTMTDIPTPSENTERPQAPVSPPAPGIEHRPEPGQHVVCDPYGAEGRGTRPPRPEAPPETPRPPAEPPAPQGHWAPPREERRPSRHEQGPPTPYESQSPSPSRHQGTEQGWDRGPDGQDPYGPRGRQGPAAPYEYRAPQGHGEGQGHPGPYGHQGPPAHPGPQGYPDHGYRGGYEPNSYYYQRPYHEAHPAAPPAGYPRADYPTQPPQPPVPQPAPHYQAYAQPMPYQNAYPLPYQPPGYVLPGQPMVYPGQFAPYGQINPYGQPVQHVIVLAAGQQPQVITAESAATLFAERAEPTLSPEVRQDKALTRAEEAGEETAPERDRPNAETPIEQETEAPTPAPEPEDGVVQEEETAAKTEAAEAVSEVLRDSTGDLLNEALAGLAMRDLSLVDALLEMVEELETSAQDPDLLDKLFQIDNFATRMRRNGENFLVLTGHDGGESDAHDEIVPLLDVARAATSEIKDYPRVTLGKIPQASITGLAADDISHLLAELLDNATANSPEHSQVVISAQELDDGRLMIVVEDEGVGIPESQLAELNNRLEGEPVLDDEVPRHMGLYVASRIARKHGLEARLEPRSFRGVSAYTIIPQGLLRVATPRVPGQARTSTTPSASASVTPIGSTGNGKTNGTNGSSGANGAPKPSTGGSSAVTAAGLPRRSATPHGSPLRMMPHPGALSDNPPPAPKGREDTPPKLTGEARAEQIRDEIGDFLDGERAALEGEELEGDQE